MKIGEAATGIGEEMADTGLAIQRAQDKTEQMQARASAVDELVESRDARGLHARARRRSTASWPRSPRRARSTRSWRSSRASWPPAEPPKELEEKS